MEPITKVETALSNDLQMTSAYIAIGMVQADKFEKAQDLWGCGQIELVDEAIKYAAHINELRAKLNEYTDLAGVFDYEVSEIFGTWFTEHTANNDGEIPSDGACRARAKELVLEFFVDTCGMGRNTAEELLAA